MRIEQPTLIINKERVKKNIAKMVKKAHNSNVIIRPHFKTHQSSVIGKWFKDAGVNSITVSSVDMAEYFAENGWTDILIAFPVNILQIKRINELAKKISLHLLIEAEEVIVFLDQNLDTEVNIWLKIDTGYHRTGIDWNDEATISHLIREIKKSNKLIFQGLLVHAGHTYRAKSIDAIKEIYEDTYLKLKDIQERLLLQGFSIVKLSIGDTPSCSVVDNFKGVNEIRPGNFVFFDFTQLKLGSCKEDEIAVALACPIVAKHLEREEILIYGGAIHLSKEFIQNEQELISYGAISLPDNTGWGEIIENAYVKSISQEHGVVKAPLELINKLKIGDLLYIIPVHSCLTANLMKQYFTLEGDRILMMPT